MNQITGLLSPFLQNKRIGIIKGLLSGRVLDFGCGNGALLRYCVSQNYTGVDIDKQLINSLGGNGRFLTIDELKNSNLKFDTIVMLAVIEHIQDPLNTLCLLKTYLNAGGKIIITAPSPNFEWLHKLGSILKLCSKEAANQHCSKITHYSMRVIASQLDMELECSKKFLLGLNQLFILK